MQLFQHATTARSSKRKSGHLTVLLRLPRGLSWRSGYHSEAETRVLEHLDGGPQDDFTRLLRSQINGWPSARVNGRPNLPYHMGRALDQKHVVGRPVARQGQRPDSSYKRWRASPAALSTPPDLLSSDLAGSSPSYQDASSNLKTPYMRAEKANIADVGGKAAAQRGPGRHHESPAASSVEHAKLVRRCKTGEDTLPLVRYPISASHDSTTLARSRILHVTSLDRSTEDIQSENTSRPTAPISYYSCTDTGLFTSTGARIHGAEYFRKSAGVTPPIDIPATIEDKSQVAEAARDNAALVRFHPVHDSPESPINRTHSVTKLARKSMRERRVSRKNNVPKGMKRTARKSLHRGSTIRKRGPAVETDLSAKSIESSKMSSMRRPGLRRKFGKMNTGNASSSDKLSSGRHHLTTDQIVDPAPSNKILEPAPTAIEDTALNAELDLILDSYRGLPNGRYESSIHNLPKVAPPIRRMRSAPTSLNRVGPESTPFHYGASPRAHPIHGSSSTKSRHMSVSAYKAVHTSNLARSKADVDDIGKASQSKPNIREHLKSWELVASRKAQTQAHCSQTIPAGSTGDVLGLGDHDNTLEEINDIYNDDNTLETEQLGTYQMDDESMLLNQGLHVLPGDLTAWGKQEGDVLRVLISVHDNKGYFYSERGDLFISDMKYAKFSVSQFVDSRALSKILPYLPSFENRDKYVPVDIPRDVGAMMINKMLRFREAADACFREYADRIGSAYEILAPRGNENPRTISLQSAASQILQKNDQKDLTAPMLWTIDRTLRRTQYVTSDRLRHRQHQEFTIFPQEYSERLDQVRKWVQAYQEDAVQKALETYASTNDQHSGVKGNPIPAFLIKIRRIVQSHRHDRPTYEGTIGPGLTKIESSQEGDSTWKAVDSAEVFEKDEQKILEFLSAWAVLNLFQISSSLTAIGPMILRATGLYDDRELTRETAYTLLQELGILKPWDRVESFNSDSVFPTQAQHCRTSYDRLEIGSDDSMAKRRRDWADLAVFCIDSEQTVERDDGISLELDRDDVSMRWLHIHIANPTAFIEYASPTADYAAALGQSIYFPEQRYPMMDPALSRDKFSLRNGGPCFTVSVKVAENGEIVEKQISHGIVHNVQYTTPEEVQHRVFGDPLYPDHSENILLRVGTPVASKIPTYEPRTVLEPSHVETLREIITISSKMKEHRYHNFDQNHEHGLADLRALSSSLNKFRDYLSVKVNGSPSIPNPPSLDLSRSRQFVGDPVITIRRGVQRDTDTINMVAELMILAGSVCASWCSDRGIPIPYRGTERNPKPWYDPATYAKTYVEPAVRSGTAVDKHLKIYQSLFGSIRQSSSPLEHLTIGVPAYCRATSPLRRYADMITHWQIEAALRHEHDNHVSLVGADASFYNDHTILPCSRADIDVIAEKTYRQERKIQYAAKLAKNVWVAQALNRALNFKETPLENTFHVKIHALESTTSKFGAAGVLESWGRPVCVPQTKASEAVGGLRVGDVWKGPLTCIRPYWNYLALDAEELIQRPVEVIRTVA